MSTTLKTASSGAKSAFSSFGYMLSPEEEHLVARAEASGINWQNLLNALAALKPVISDIATLIPVIISFFGLTPGPTPAPVQSTAKTCCDHHKCCCDALRAILRAAQIEARHMCECCAYG